MDDKTETAAAKAADQERTRAALEIELAAHLAEGDLEEMLVQLDELAERRRKDPVVEARYEELRDLCAKAILREGPRYYLDARGVKRYAFAVQPEPVEIDVGRLMDFYADGSLPVEVLNKIAPRKVDKDAYRRAAAKGELTKEQIAATARIRKGTPHVRFADPVDS